MNNHTVEPRFEYAMNLLSKKWNGMIIYLLLNGPVRPSKIQLTLGISARMLSIRLKELEKQNIIQRKVYPEYPVVVQYCLTEKGQALKPVFKEVEKWANNWLGLNKWVV